MLDPSKYSTRLVALKIAYLGQRYNGLEHHSNNTTPLPTIEEELWKSLKKAHLIFPQPNPNLSEGDVNWEGCDYSKCGRTDKGVSAFGQVIALRVRSNRPCVEEVKKASLSRVPIEVVEKDGSEISRVSIESSSPHLGEDGDTFLPSSTQAHKQDHALFNPICDEIPYAQILNRLLPPDIRVLAWCPSPPHDFSARFSCEERRYKYFFTQPAFSFTPSAMGSSADSQDRTTLNPRRGGWLDIQAMKKAARKFEGLHDFRNFCKLDASKQMESLERRVHYANIEEVSSSSRPVVYTKSLESEEIAGPFPGYASPLVEGTACQASDPILYTFTLHGSSFLWHQVRHMVAILFLVGQGLESPELVDELLDIQKTPQKPQYDMANDAPLVLWDCIFPLDGRNPREDALEWVHVGDYTGYEKGVLQAATGKGNDKYGLSGIADDIWKVWRHKKMEEVLAASLLDLIMGRGSRAGSHGISAKDELGGASLESRTTPRVSQKIFLGGDSAKWVGKYIPVLERPRMESVTELNAKYAKRKGFEHRPEVIKEGFRRVPLESWDDVGEQEYPLA